MRNVRMAIGLSVCLWALDEGRADACGDKFVRTDRGGRFQRGYVAVHPASALVYVNKSSPGAGSMRKLPATLKAAGHKAVAVDSVSAFQEALQAGKYDIVLVEAADIPSLEPGIRAAASRPRLLPVLRKPTKAEIEAVTKQHGCAIEDPENKYGVLVDIDKLMEQKAQ